MGKAINKEDVDKIKDVVNELFDKSDEYKTNISRYFEDYTFNHGKAAEVGAKYILKSLVEKQKLKNKKEEK